MLLGTLQAVRWATMDDCTDRWFDKSYALIIYRNGLLSSACDVSCAYLSDSR